MSRYFAEISYDGSGLSGWQFQKNAALTVQQIIEEGLQKLLKRRVPIVGCGRTDAGVHAKGYFYHFDIEEGIDHDWVADKLNHVLPRTIATHRIIPVSDKSHARFDAYSRSYIYRLRTYPDPFDYKYAWYYRFQELDIDQMNLVAEILLNYTEFYPFCKIGSDVKTYICMLTHARWTFNETKRVYEFRITSNRFLRGMIRLIVGTCVHVQRGNLTLQDVITALDNQTRLPKEFAAPAEGLCLYDIKYPQIEPLVSYDVF